MTKKDAINILGWTRQRLTRILESLPDSFLEFKPDLVLPKTFQYKKPFSILSHIVGVENYWIHEKILKKEIDKKHQRFKDQTIAFVMSKLELIRKQTTDWIEQLEFNNLDIPYSERAKTNISWIIYHVAEHEAHHLAQIDMLAGFAGLKTPWV